MTEVGLYEPVGFSQDGKFLANNRDDSGEASVVGGLNSEGLGCIVPSAHMSVLLGAAATTATDANGDTEDANVTSGTGSALQLGVKRACSLGANSDLVAHARRDHELSWSRKNLDILGSIRSELVLGDINVPVFALCQPGCGAFRGVKVLFTMSRE